MIILNEANRIKQHVADKLGIKLPKGGLAHSANFNSPDKERYVKDELKLFDRVYDLTHGYKPKHPSLHNSINMRSSKHPEHNLRKTKLMKRYGDKLTHKYDKQSTPNVETPKSNGKPLLLSAPKSNGKPLSLAAPKSNGQPRLTTQSNGQPRLTTQSNGQPRLTTQSNGQPPRQEAPNINSRNTRRKTRLFDSKPPKIAPNPKPNSSWFGRNKGKVALGVGVGTAAAYGIHKYRQNKKKKEEEEARRKAEEAQKKTGIKRFFK